MNSTITVLIESAYPNHVESAASKVVSSAQHFGLQSVRNSEKESHIHDFVEGINFVELLLSGVVGVALSELVRHLSYRLNESERNVEVKKDKIRVIQKSRERRIELIDIDSGTKVTLIENTTESSSF